MSEGKKLGEKVDAAFSWASDVKRSWMFVLGGLALGIILSLIFW